MRRTRIKGILPRIALKIKDNKTGSYPSIFRTGDSRTGNYNVFYDDVKTVNFSNVSSANADTSSSVKEDPLFNLRFNNNFYSGSNFLLAYWRFEPGEILSQSNNVAIAIDVGKSASIHITGSTNSLNNVLPYTPGTGSKQSIGNLNIPGTHFFGIDSVAALTSLSSSLAFGNAATDRTRTISVWLNKTQPLSTTGSIFMAKSGSTAREYEMGIKGTTDVGTSDLFMRLWDNSATRFIEARTSAFQSGAISLNSWFHLAITYDGSSSNNGINFFINGQRQSKTVSTSGGYVASEQTLQPFYVGAANTGSGGVLARPWGGYIDDLAIFDRVLGEHEIKQIMAYRKGISMPVGLDANSPFLTENERTSLFVPGTIRKGLSDNFVQFTPGQDYAAYNESFRPEQSSNNSFYLTGSPESETSLYFSSKLASKTQIKFQFYISTATLFNETSASIIYLNKNIGDFAIIGGNERITNPAAPAERYNVGKDCKLFGPLGTPQISGTTGASQFPAPGLTTSEVKDGIDAGLLFVQTSSVCLNSLFAAHAGQIIPMSGVLSAPFLLERAVIELPISSSSNWFNDFTRFGVVSGGITNGYSDCGGPCITVSLLNQFASNRREIILSSTIIPATDNVSMTYTPNDSVSSVAGFLSFGTPGAVVPSVGAHRVLLEAKPTVSHGLISVSNLTNKLFSASIMAEVSSFGRAMDNSANGRSFFGKEFSLPQYNDNFPVKYTNLSASSQAKLFQFQNNTYSPYLLLPEDNLILAISKHRAIMTSLTTRTSLTASHSVWIPTGTINIVLYGSLIRNEKEYHDTLNQQLTSNAIHEYIHFDNPVVDQFDVNPKINFSGSYIDEFFTGSIFASRNPIIDGRRGRKYSLIKFETDNNLNASVDLVSITSATTITVRNAMPGFHRNVQLFNENDRYYDTLVPNAESMVRLDGGAISVDTSLNLNYFNIGRVGNPADVNNVSFNQSWDFLFPFEARYSEIERMVSYPNYTVSTVDTGGSNNRQINKFATANRSGTFGNVGAAVYGFVPSTGSSRIDVNPPVHEVLKALYGIGDGVFRAPIIDQQAFAAIRGTKYGLKNVVREVSKCYFRRDQYGQLRDMMEQSRDSKFFIEGNSSIVESPIKIRFISSSGTFTDGLNTDASNVSNEATSSIPYFDGVARNRATTSH